MQGFLWFVYRSVGSLWFLFIIIIVYLNIFDIYICSKSPWLIKGARRYTILHTYGKSISTLDTSRRCASPKSDCINLFVYSLSKIASFSVLCLCLPCPGSHVRHSNTSTSTSTSTRRRKKFLFPMFAFMLASLRFTRTFSCAYACVVMVNQPLKDTRMYSSKQRDFVRSCVEKKNRTQFSQ